VQRNAAQGFNADELRVLNELSSPERIQYFLSGLKYSSADFYRCPTRVIRDREAHCFDGALFAAAALRRLKFPPLVIEMRAEQDDVHLIAPYKVKNCWGALAKSNFTGINSREPVYRNLRELVMSYFEQFFNVKRMRTLRGYTRPLNLSRFDRLNWMVSDEHLQEISDRLDRMKTIPVIGEEMVRKLSLVDERSYLAGLLGANPSGLWRPPDE
jgi:hypothetical protein